MKNIIILLTVVMLFTGCTSKSDAENALKGQGFTNVKVTGYKFFACSKDDFYHTGFTATNLVGNTVEGVACSGFLFKGTTLRW